MDLPENRFKRAIVEGKAQIGLWCSLSDAYALEAVAGAPFDWLLIDTEHSPAGLESVLAQLQAAAAYPVSAAVRPAANDPVLIKRILDIGAQTLLAPYVQTAAEAAAAVAATRYPPEGVRGVSALTRASRFGRAAGYARRAAEEICVIVQVETREALERLDEIALTPGVDGVFIGPGDLAASLGFVGEPGRAEVKAAVRQAIERLRVLGRPSGLLTADAAFARECLDLGAAFVAVGVDAGLLARGADALAAQFGKDPR